MSRQVWKPFGQFVLFGMGMWALLAVSASAADDDSVYSANPLLPRVTAALTRLEKQGGMLKKDILTQLQAEAAKCLAVEEQYKLERMPIQAEIRTARTTHSDLVKTQQELTLRIEALNSGKVEQDEKLDDDKKKFQDKKSAHIKYLGENLNPRIAAEVHQVSQQYLAFARRVDMALLPPGQKSALQPFKTSWEAYRVSRPIAKGLADDQNRCALVLSMALDLRPQVGEASLADIADPSVVERTLKLIREEYPTIREIKDSDLGRRYYIRAAELASRFKSDWGEPEIVDNPARLTNRKGVIFFKEAYGGVNHIDLWDGGLANDANLASQLRPAFQTAKAVWFWEVPE